MKYRGILLFCYKGVIKLQNQLEYVIFMLAKGYPGTIPTCIEILPLEVFFSENRVIISHSAWLERSWNVLEGYLV